MLDSVTLAHVGSEPRNSLNMWSILLHVVAISGRSAKTIGACDVQGWRPELDSPFANTVGSLAIIFYAELRKYSTLRWSTGGWPLFPK